MIPKHQCHIYTYDLRKLPKTSLYPLTPYEKQKANRLYKKTQYQHIRYLIRDILSTYNIPPQDLHYSEKGKPLLHGNISLNITHSQHTLIIALMQTTHLGIDLQIPLPKNPSTLTKRCNLPPHTTTERLMQHWVICEAYCKCVQTPLLKTLTSPIDLLIKQRQLFVKYIQKPHHLAIVSTDKIANIVAKTDLGLAYSQTII